MSLLLALACAGPDEAVDPLAGLTFVQEDPSSAPLAGLSLEWSARFEAGEDRFNRVFREGQGLGPAYARASCASCHAGGASGPGLVTTMVVMDGDAPAADQSLLAWGHAERPFVAGGALTPVLAPDDPSVRTSLRRPPAAFGRGYLEAVADDAILEEEARQAQEGLVSGRANRACWDFAAGSDEFHAFSPGECDLVGRFGLKARAPALDGIAADAYQGFLSLTSPLRPDELANPDGLGDDAWPGEDIDADALAATAAYARLLDIPRRALDDAGAALFADAGCAACHAPAMPTRSDYPVPQLAGIDAPIYSDLLLHDMGAAFSDGLAEGDAQPSEWRTAPLMGMRFLRTYLHDGRALTVEDAVLAHGEAGSEAAFSVDRFLALPDEDQDALVAFVESL